MNAIKRFFSFAVTVGVIIGLRVYSKNSDHDELKEAMLKQCNNEAQCVASLNASFDSCFDTNYHSTRRGSDFNAEGFKNCMNAGQSAGAHS